MSKETTAGIECACGQRIAFPTYHWPHCAANPANMNDHERDRMKAIFGPAQLAMIDAFGPQMAAAKKEASAKTKRLPEKKKRK